MFKIVFICEANSTRIQLAQGLARQKFGAQVSIESGGSFGQIWINPFVKIPRLGLAQNQKFWPGTIPWQMKF